MRKGLWVVTLDTGAGGDREEILVEASTMTEAESKAKKACYNYGVLAIRALTLSIVPDLSIYKNGDTAVEV